MALAIGHYNPIALEKRHCLIQVVTHDKTIGGYAIPLSRIKRRLTGDSVKIEESVNAYRSQLPDAKIELTVHQRNAPRSYISQKSEKTSKELLEIYDQIQQFNTSLGKTYGTIPSNIIGMDGHSLLHAAVQVCSVPLCYKLLMAGSDPESTKGMFGTPVNLAESWLQKMRRTDPNDRTGLCRQYQTILDAFRGRKVDNFVKTEPSATDDAV